MKTLAFASLVAFAACAHSSADTAPRGPDFVEHQPKNDGVGALAASDGAKPIEPVDVVQFALASADLTPTAQTQLQRTIEYLAKHPTEHLVLEGHTDRSGSFAYNEDLATRRAEGIRSELTLGGVAADRILVAVFGEAQADPGVNSYDRRVVMFASDKPTPAIISGELAKERALSVVWSDHGQLMVEDAKGVVSKR